MKELTKLVEPFGVIERLMQSDWNSSEDRTVDPLRQPDLDMGSIVQFLKRVHEAQVGSMPTTMDSLRLNPAASGSHPAPALPPQQDTTLDQWPAAQQEMRLWCVGDSTGGKFVVINEKDEPDAFTFECTRPVGVLPELWSELDIALAPNTLELAPLKQGLVSLRINFNGHRPAVDKFEFCVNVRSRSGALVSKLWVDVVFADSQNDD